MLGCYYATNNSNQGLKKHKYGFFSAIIIEDLGNICYTESDADVVHR